MQVMRAAVGQVDFAVDDISVRAGGGAVEGPLELAEGNGQSAERHVALRARIAQTLGLAGQVGCDGGQQLGFVEVEALSSARA